MKLTPETTPQPHGSRTFPLTDYSFRPAVEPRTIGAAVLATRPRLSFHKLSSEVFSAKKSPAALVELFLFTMIAGICAWPMISGLVAVVRMARNY